MTKLAAFRGVTTPVSDLALAIQNQGWQLGQVKFDTGLNAYTAEALSPHGERVSKTGPDEATAVANTLLAVTRRNHMRTTAQYKVGMWRTNFHERSREIAEAYRDAPIYDPKAVAAWKALGDDSMHRLHVLGSQLHIEPTNEPQPYKSADEMRKDVHEKKHYYLSLAGVNHPVWTADQVGAFRAVHDILGHGVSGGHYDWPGRVLAANAHFPLLEPLAQQALFSEAIARPAFLHTYGYGPQKVALFPEFMDHHQEDNNPSAHTGIHPSQTTAPVASAEGFALLGKRASWGNTIDVNKGWDPGIEPMPQNAYIHHGDPMQYKPTMDNAGLIDTGWSKFQKGDGSDDRERMKLAIVNAFRVVLLSPRKDLRWNAIHYQDIANIPGGVDDPKVYWDTLERARRSWNEKQGIDPEAHMVYYKFLKPFEARIAADHPEKGWEWAKQEAKQVLFNWWTEEQERIQADDAQKPADKQRHADEIERRANEALARRMQLFLKPKDDKTDVEDIQMSMFGARKESDDWQRITDALVGPSNPAKQPSTWEENRAKWIAEQEGKRAEERALFKRDPQAYYHKMWGGEGDVTHPYYSKFIEWVPIQHVLPYAEWRRNPAHGAPEGEAATQQYWDILKNHVLANGIQNPIRLFVHPEDGMGHIGEGNHRLAVADALGMTHVPVTVGISRRRGNSQYPVPGFDRYAPRDEMLRPSDVGIPVQKTAAGGQYNLLTGEEALKYGAFMGTHLKAIAQISQHADEILDAALEDVRQHDGEGHHFRHEVLKLGVSGVGPKVCSFAWLLLQPLTSQLATIDTHMMDVLGHDYEKEMNNRDYFKFEREFRAGLDAAGYSHLPLGAGQWGMWDFKRTGPGTHQDHSAMRVLDPKPHQEVDWVGKAVNLKGESWLKQAPDWWQNTQPARDAIAREWDQTYGKTFAQNQIPYQDLGQNTMVSRTILSYDHPFSYYWDRSMPVGASLESKARTLAEHAKADDLSYEEFEEWLEDHKSDTRLSSEAFKRFKTKALKKRDRLSKTAAVAKTPSFIHPETNVPYHGMPGQSMMEHARLQTGLSTQDVWRLLADEHVHKADVDHSQPSAA